MISKATIKRIHALEMRKYRKNERLFVAEGPKLVNELYMSMKPVYVAALPEWIASNANLLNNTTYDTLTPEELQKASLLMHPQQVIALFQIPENELNPDLLKDEIGRASCRERV